MTGGQWEKVGPKSKRSKQNNGVSRASKEKKKLSDAAFEVSAPVTEAQTIYSAFLEKEKKDPPVKQKSTSVESTKGKEKNPQSKKKKDKKNSPAKVNLEKIFSEVSEEDLKNHLAKLELLYPDNHLVWLKDVTSFFNIKLDVPADEALFTGKSGFPSALLHKDVYKMLVKMFSWCTQQTLQIFFEQCLTNMVQDLLKGIHTLGYRTVLQCLAQEMPNVALAALPKCLELCTAHQNRHNICVSVMWVAGQAGNKKLEAGFAVWTGLMFPLIGSKTCTSYVVDYLENLMQSKDLSKINKSIISIKDLFYIFDFMCSKDLAKNIQKRLVACYPTLKALSYGPEPELVLHHYFPSYLHRLNPQCPQLMKEEILSSLVYCLENDLRNYSIWRQLYSKHFNKSKMLIAHLNDSWEKLPSKFPKRCLLDTLSAFQVTNEELLNSNRKDPSVEECILLNKELLSKINSQMFPWIRMILISILVLSLLVTYDIVSHGSFPESHIGKLMKDTGLLVVCAQIGEKLSYYYGKVFMLLETYVPSFVSWTQKSVGPYLKLFWKRFVDICLHIWDSSSPFRMYVGNYVQMVLNEVDAVAPAYGNWILSYSRGLTLFLKSHLASISQSIWSLLESVILWAESNSTIQDAMDSSVKYISYATETLQSYALTLMKLLKQYIPS